MHGVTMKVQKCLYLAGFVTGIPNSLTGRQYCDPQINTRTRNTDLKLYSANKANSPVSPISVPCALCICLQFPQLFPEANVQKNKDKQCTYNVKLRRVRATIVVVEKR